MEDEFQRLAKERILGLGKSNFHIEIALAPAPGEESEQDERSADS